jgi:hypothetical protein
MRVGGYNNDVNLASPFDNAAFDKAVAYARAIGAEPIIQVPLLADTAGQLPTAATAAGMVTYANVTKGYGIKYFSIGNEPDLYATQGLPADSTQPAIPGYTPSDYCASATGYVAAMKAVDPTIKIVGPDLSWKYQAGNGANDWLTPILEGCGALFDVIAIHRYPFEAAQATLAAAAADPAAFRNVIAQVRGILQAAGQGEKPLALTEMNVAYDATSCVLDASPGTVGSALWLADSVGTAIELGLWTSAVWDISDLDDWGLGLIGMPPAHTPRPSYYAYSLYADHFGPTLLDVTSVPAGVSAHASRNAADDATEVIAINWNASAVELQLEVTGLPAAPTAATFVVPAVSIAAVEIPDTGPASAWVYAEAQRQAAVGPQLLGVGAWTYGAGATGGAGRAAGAGCGGKDAAVGSVDGGISGACNATIPEAVGNLTVSGEYVTVGPLHGYGSVWAWEGTDSQATICVLPSCTSGDAMFFTASGFGVSPFTAEAVSCSPDLGTSALCAAGSMSADSSYASVVGIGFNFNQNLVDGGDAGGVGTLAITDSITVTTALFGGAVGNSALRLQLTDADGNYYCVEAGAWQSGTPIPISKFKQACWGGSGSDTAAFPGILARRLDVIVPGTTFDRDFSYCLTDLAAR